MYTSVFKADLKSVDLNEFLDSINHKETLVRIVVSDVSSVKPTIRFNCFTCRLLVLVISLHVLFRNNNF